MDKKISYPSRRMLIYWDSRKLLKEFQLSITSSWERFPYYNLNCIFWRAFPFRVDLTAIDIIQDSNFQEIVGQQRINESCSLGNHMAGCNTPQTPQIKLKVPTIFDFSFLWKWFLFLEIILLYNEALSNSSFWLVLCVKSLSILWSQHVWLLEKWSPWK